ncbi:uncharacterized protein PFL1_04849 [Pseudozyma flocculosa PF-1]|nr:uncharacterized protein PFL1_04849 [Pseudozyma flocculosa PF-1]EPQ27711.1 hypothetical protein PFL1_04849 [Pseudozyma flocculosa PF-1]
MPRSEKMQRDQNSTSSDGNAAGMEGTSPPSLSSPTLDLLSAVLRNKAQSSAKLRSLRPSPSSSRSSSRRPGAPTTTASRSGSHSSSVSASSSWSESRGGGGWNHSSASSSTSCATSSSASTFVGDEDGDEDRGRKAQRASRKAGTYEIVDESEALADLERLNGINFDDPWHIGSGALPISLPPPSSSTRTAVQEEAGGRGGGEGRITLDDFYTLFGEDWQLSQFWYTQSFTEQLAHLIHHLVYPSQAEGSEETSTRKTIAFLCSPTAYVGYHHFISPSSSKMTTTTKLLEYDTRFELLAPGDFVKYDLHDPLNLPSDLEANVDLCIVDPPFLNLDTNLKIAQTVRRIKRPGRDGKVLLITGDSIVEQVKDLYLDDLAQQQQQPPHGGMKRLDIEVQHRGLANEFGAWCNV